jgi:hypothetical protein
MTKGQQRQTPWWFSNGVETWMIFVTILMNKHIFCLFLPFVLLLTYIGTRGEGGINTSRDILYSLHCCLHNMQHQGEQRWTLLAVRPNVSCLPQNEVLQLQASQCGRLENQRARTKYLFYKIDYSALLLLIDFDQSLHASWDGPHEEEKQIIDVLISSTSTVLSAVISIILISSSTKSRQESICLFVETFCSYWRNRTHKIKFRVFCVSLRLYNHCSVEWLMMLW